MAERTQTFSFPEGDITLSTGKFAKLASGSVLAQKGGTVVLATATVDKRETKQDFFPLSVEYIEKLYAGGTISGSRFLKREGFPSEDAIVRARQVDHTIRPLFPKGFRQAVAVVLTVLAYDGHNDPEALSVLAASAALTLSDIPFFGPAASVVMGVQQDGTLVINPLLETHEELAGLFAISGTHDKILNFEGWGIELSEEKMGELIDMAVERISALTDLQTTFGEGLAKPKQEFAELHVNKDLVEQIMSEQGEKLSQALYVEEKTDRNAGVAAIKAELNQKLVSEDSEFSEFDIDMAVEYAARKIMRKGIMEGAKRFSGRALDEIRPLSAEVDALPTVHGSAVFNRGLTQSLSIVTLGSTRVSQTLENMEGERIKGFMHHYNMPSFSTGEAGRYMYKPGRREIGHGAIGENALKNMVPSQDEFPYTVRVVSEILSSNGSTSMAATCAASLALMAAGVPLKSAVAGIGVGLVTNDENEGDYRLLLDIEGVEDFYGDMDFKVTGTDKGVTAIQFETKLKGVSANILKEAFQLSRSGRAQVLEAMNSAIAEPRAELSPTAPRVDMVMIPVDRIGELIGPGGKNIRALTDHADSLGDGKVEVDIAEDGRVTVTAVNKEQRDYVVESIRSMMQEPEIGNIYDGVIDKVMPYGAFVNVTPGITGLIHVSELADGFVADPAQVVTEGQEVKVRLTKIENGKQSFSIKAANDPNWDPSKVQSSDRPGRDRGGFGGDRGRGGDRGGRGGDRGGRGGDRFDRGGPRRGGLSHSRRED